MILNPKTVVALWNLIRDPRNPSDEVAIKVGRRINSKRTRIYGRTGPRARVGFVDDDGRTILLVKKAHLRAYLLRHNFDDIPMEIKSA